MARSGSCTAHMMGCRRSRRRSGRSSGRRQRHAAPTPSGVLHAGAGTAQPVGSAPLAVLITGHDLEPIAAQVTGLAELDRLAKHPGAARPPIGHVPDCPHRAGSPDLAGGDDTGSVVQQGAQRTGRCRRGAQRRRNDAKTQHARVAAANLSTSRRETDICHRVRQKQQLSHWFQWSRMHHTGRTHACGHTDTGAVSGRPPLLRPLLRCDRLRSQRRNGQNRRATALEARRISTHKNFAAS